MEEKRRRTNRHAAGGRLRAAAQPRQPAPSAKSRRAPAARAGWRAGPGAQGFSVSQGVAAAARRGQVGELFQYAIDKPVTLPRQQSAMLPILNQQVSGERYRCTTSPRSPKYPLNAVKLKNTSSLHLMQGPITVFDGGSYAGDAQITDLPPGGEQLVTYAMDLDTEVEAVAGPAPDTLVSVKISKGVFFYTNRQQKERIYNVKSRGTKRPDGAHRAPLPAGLDPGQPQGADGAHHGTSTVSPPRCRGQDREALRCGDPHGGPERFAVQPAGDQVAFYVRSPVVSPAVKAALQKLVALQQKLSDTVSQRTRRRPG